MTLEEFQKEEWYKSRPKVIQQAIDKLPPIHKYKFKDSGKQCCIVSYSEPISGRLDDVTIVVQKLGIGGAMDEMGLGELDKNQVFDVKLDDLEICTDDDK